MFVLGVDIDGVEELEDGTAATTDIEGEEDGSCVDGRCNVCVCRCSVCVCRCSVCGCASGFACGTAATTVPEDDDVTQSVCCLLISLPTSLPLISSFFLLLSTTKLP